MLISAIKVLNIDFVVAFILPYITNIEYNKNNRKGITCYLMWIIKEIRTLLESGSSEIKDLK